MLITQAIRDYLAADATLTALLPEQSGFADATTSPQKKAASVFHRRTHQNAVRPFVLVGLGYDYDAGNDTEATDVRKIEHFSIYISTDADANSISAIELKVRQILETVKQMYLPSALASGKIWTQSLLLQDRRFVDGPNVDGGEEGLSSWVLIYLVAYDEPAA